MRQMFYSCAELMCLLLAAAACQLVEGSNTCNDTDIRLVNGRTEFEGRVEICLGGIWGLVCDNMWDDADAAVVCRQQGFTSDVNVSSLRGAYFGVGAEDVLLDNVQCNGTESQLADCMRGEISCDRRTSHNSRVSSVACKVYTPEQVCRDKDIRLVNGSSNFDGRVEVCFNGTWGTVCDDEWSSSAASVVCRQLKLNVQGASAGTYGSGVGPIFLDDVRCRGTETLLTDCHHNGVGVHNCRHSEDAGVNCQGNMDDTTNPVLVSVVMISVIAVLLVVVVVLVTIVFWKRTSSKHESPAPREDVGYVDMGSVSNRTSLFLQDGDRFLGNFPHNATIMNTGLPLPHREYNPSPSHVYESLSDLLSPQPYESPCKCQPGDEEHNVRSTDETEPSSVDEADADGTPPVMKPVISEGKEQCGATAADLNVKGSSNPYVI